jgi:hypothetical protein
VKQMICCCNKVWFQEFLWFMIWDACKCVSIVLQYLSALNYTAFKMILHLLSD